MGGGKGTRLYPLTKERAKPAVPFGTKYRLVDIPLSNSINSGFKKIYILTQFNSASLHMHLSQSYNFDTFTRGFVEILAAEQTFEHSSWYEGTADAVRKNFAHFHSQSPSHYLILSGDQLYRMNLQDLYRQHIETGADITIACTPVGKERSPAFGILQTDPDCRVTGFVEKPPLERDISEFRFRNSNTGDKGRDYLGSMGIYFFNAGILEKVLDNEYKDFGHEIVPKAIEGEKVFAYAFHGFWEDIGTIKSFYETNLDLASVNPSFNFYDENSPIYTRRRYLPASKFNRCTLSNSLTAEGCIISDAEISNSLIGIRTVINKGVYLDGAVCMGSDYYETPGEKQQNREKGIPDLGIGEGTVIRRAIIDKDARIGRGCKIGIHDTEPVNGDFSTHFIRDGVVIVPKGMTVPDGSVL
jgi:glucose-1-phosphate adenylyltransferase